MNLTAQNLTLCYGARVILEDVSCEIRPGEITGVIGPNGAGKSTLVKAFAGLVPVTSGQIRLNGRDLSSLPARERAQQMAYLPQERQVHWPLAVRRVAALGRIPHLLPWQKPDAADEAAVEEALARTDAAALADRRFHELAGGEKALVLLARALASGPSVLLADEPVSGLDPNHEIQVMQVLAERAHAGAAVLVVLHQLTLAARFCDRLLLLARGKIQAAGTPDTVLTPDHLRTSFGIEAVFGREGGERFVVPWSRT